MVSITFCIDHAKSQRAIIINDEKLISLSISMFEMRKTLTYSVHPKLGWVVMTSGDKKNLATDILMVMLAKITRARYIRVRTFDEALQHLRNVDPTIDWDAVSMDEHNSL